MHPFTYAAPTDEGTARNLALAAGARFLAGGTTLVDLMKLEVERPTRLVDIGSLPLTAVEALSSGGVRIGAMVRNSDLAFHELIRTRYPVLSQALLAGASPQLRNMATTGGNLLQRTRCYYFRDTAAACNKRRPGSGCPAIDGYNRIHAVLGTSEHCIATHASDMAVALVALDALVRVRGLRGERAIPINEFYVLPDIHPERETVLEQGELIVAVELPPIPWATRSLYIKVRDRASYAFALASAAVALDLRNGVIHDARLALGGVATKPWRARHAEQALIGGSLSTTAFQTAADLALAGAIPRAYNAFKIDLAKRTVLRALARVGAMT
jgi:xanthine dehydrogenase YagS FAD-binding subunit